MRELLLHDDPNHISQRNFNLGKTKHEVCKSNDVKPAEQEVFGVKSRTVIILSHMLIF